MQYNLLPIFRKTCLNSSYMKTELEEEEMNNFLIYAI